MVGAKADIRVIALIEVVVPAIVITRRRATTARGLVICKRIAGRSSVMRSKARSPTRREIVGVISDYHAVEEEVEEVDGV